MTNQGKPGYSLWPKWPLQRVIAVFALVVSIVFCALVANDLRRDYQQQLAAASAKSDGMTRLLEEHARQSMRRLELTLADAAQVVQAQAKGDGRLPRDTAQRLQALLPQDQLIASLDVLDGQGNVLASTLHPGALSPASGNVGHDAQARPKGPQNAMVVGAAVRSQVSGNWVIPVSIRLQGRFDGYLSAALESAYFQRLYQSIDTGSQGFVALFTTEGWTVARWPFDAGLASRNWKNSPYFPQGFDAHPYASLRLGGSPSAPEIHYSYRTLNDYPLMVAIGMPLDEILDGWRKRALYELVAALAVLLFLGVCTSVVLGQLRRRVQAESALQLSENSVLKSSLPTLWIGADGRILRVNQAACDLHGYSEAQMLGMTVMDLNPSMPEAHWPDHWKRLRKAGHMQFETAHLTATGTLVPIEADLNFIEFAGREYNFAFIRDLTARKQTEAEIQRSGAMLRGAMDAVDEAFVLFDSDDKLVYCNAKYAELYPHLKDMVVPGARFEDMIREGARRGLYRDSQGREEEWIAERMRAHREGEEARVQVRDDGRVFRVIDRRTPEGNIVGIRIDITDMVQATEEAQEASRYKSQFLANMSHEIRTPMNAILGLLALLQKTELTATQRDYADKTQGAARSLLGLVNDILDFSKVEAGKMELDLQPVQLEYMLDDIAVIASSSVGVKPIEVLFDIASDVPAEVMADALRLQQVLLNLLGNAIKFTQEGQVVLRMRCVPAPAGVEDDCHWVEFAVLDTGIGIAVEKQEHIFTGFSQAESTTTRRFGGTGLGLAICRHLVALMGGELKLQSAPGRGSTFGFVLPMPRTASNHRLLDRPDLSAEPLRVMVVDDHPVAREVLCNMTRSWGWHTESVANGQQALQRLGDRAQDPSRCPQVIFLAWQMPGMDGWETARQMGEMFRGSVERPRIVMVTSSDRDTLSVRTEQEQAWVECLLFKPVTPRALRDAALARPPGDAGVAQTRGSSNRPLSGMRILVVEDNLINQQVAEELLHAEGALVSLAANGQLGVDAVRASQPAFDVVLMDIQMPVLDGYGATRKIRQELGLTVLPIVAMTANAMASDRAACLAAGMNEHVGKPFDMRHLVAVLLQVTGRSPAEFGAPADAGVAFSSPLLNVQAAVERLSGLTGVYASLVPEFVKSLETVEAEFRYAANLGDMQSLVSQMHTLKGTAATLGAEPLSDHVAHLEKLFKHEPIQTQPLDHLPALMTLVRSTRRVAEQAIQSFASETVPPEPVRRTRSQAGAQQRTAAQAFLRKLCALMEKSDLDVLDEFARRADALDALEPEAVQAIGQALQALDLRTAMQLCVAQSKALQDEPVDLPSASG